MIHHKLIQSRLYKTWILTIYDEKGDSTNRSFKTKQEAINYMKALKKLEKNEPGYNILQ